MKEMVVAANRAKTIARVCGGRDGVPTGNQQTNQPAD
jgi:hypothetical protein